MNEIKQVVVAYQDVHDAYEHRRTLNDNENFVVTKVEKSPTGTVQGYYAVPNGKKAERVKFRYWMVHNARDASTMMGLIFHSVIYLRGKYCNDSINYISSRLRSVT